MIKQFLALLFVVPPLPVALAAESGAAPDFQALTIPQLCEMRESPQAWSEIERREAFDGRELRSIEKERIRDGIGEDALFCFKGEPLVVVPVPVEPASDPVDAYAYPHADGHMTMVHVGHAAEGSFVIGSFESDAVPDYSAMANGAGAVVCRSTNGSLRCTERRADVPEERVRTGWPGTDEFGFPPAGKNRNGTPVGCAAGC